VDLFIEQISTQNKWTPAVAKALFERMVPNEFKENLKKKGKYKLDTRHGHCRISLGIVAGKYQ
jgi:hypothetical protein